MHYIVMEPHRSEFPEPITFATGALLQVGEVYVGDEDWERWYFCETAGQKGGWVPGQIIRMLAPGKGVALEGYTARELEVDVGVQVLGSRQLNGWIWCLVIEAPSDGSPCGNEGWLPLCNLHPIAV